MDVLFSHLTTCEVIDENGENHRLFEHERSIRLHWIKSHTDEIIQDSKIVVFTITERDTKKRKDVVKTYIYNRKQKYVVVLEHQRSDAYYLLTAFHLNRNYAVKQMEKRAKKALSMME